MKTSIKIVIVIALVLIAAIGAAVGTYFLITSMNNGFSEEQFQDALNKGIEEAEAQKKYFEGLLAELEEQMKADNGEYSQLQEEYTSFVEQTKKKIEEQGALIEDVVQDKMLSLISMKETLQALFDSYTNKVASLTARVTDISESITEMQANGEDTSGNLELLKTYIEADILDYRTNIDSIQAQLDEINALIEALETPAS